MEFWSFIPLSREAVSFESSLDLPELVGRLDVSA